jgi:hypothetical protein
MIGNREWSGLKMAEVQITKILPRHIEIMNRLILGQKEVAIANDLGMSQSRISIIINSPLFQLELRRQLKKRQVRILAIEDTIIDASESGAKLLKETVEDKDVFFPLRMDAGNKALTHLFGRILRQMPTAEQPESDNPDDLPYEKRLEREITIRETTYGPKNGGGAGSDNEPESEMPPLDLMAQEEEEALDDFLNETEDDNGDGNIIECPPNVDEEDDVKSN